MRKTWQFFFFYMMEVVPFQKEPSFWVWGLRGHTVLMVLGIKTI